jgi:toxin YoeB
MMDIYWDKAAWDDYIYWTENDQKIQFRINELIRECQRTPFTGMGKPEPLKHNLSGFWSRRINSAHRLVYKVEKDVIYVAQCRYHYF